MSSDIENDNTNGSSNINAGRGKDAAKVVNLKVAEVAEQRDVGRKIARIDPKITERLNVSTGDALELSSLGKKSTVLELASKGERQRQGFDPY